MSIELRRWNMNDVNDLLLHANNYKIAKFLTDAFPHPYTRENAIKFIESVGDEMPQKVFAISKDGFAIGAIGVFPQTDMMRLNAELGYWIGESFWGQGIVSSMIPQVVEYAFSTFDIQRVYARPFSNNKASQRVLEKSGFVLEAQIKENIIKFGEILDELIYARRKV